MAINPGDKVMVYSTEKQETVVHVEGPKNDPSRVATDSGEVYSRGQFIKVPDGK